jgi:hypothetical protein
VGTEHELQKGGAVRRIQTSAFAFAVVMSERSERLFLQSEKLPT